MSETAWQAHRHRVDSLSRALKESSGPVRLRKQTSNLFRPREEVASALGAPQEEFRDHIVRTVRLKKVSRPA